MQACIAGLSQRLIHDLASNPLDLDIHLQRGDATVGAGNLEVHVTEVIFIAQDVGEYCKVIAFLDETHRNTGNRRLDWHTRIHQCEAGAAHRGHRARSV